METLAKILKESAEVYNKFLELEYEKYDVIIKDDIKKLDEIVANEQVYYLKFRGLEQKREKYINSIGMKGKTLQEIIQLSENKDKEILTQEFNNLRNIITELKRISNMCKTLIEVRLHRVENTSRSNKCLDQLF